MRRFPENYGVRMHGGRPVFTADGEPAVLAGYCSCGPGWRERWLAAHRRFARCGRKIFWLMPAGGFNGEWGTTPFWTAPGAIHFPPAPMPDGYMGLDEQARALIEIEPEARFFVRMMDMPPGTWMDANPDEVLTNFEGKHYPAASLASEQYLAELGAFLRALTRYCEEAPWSERVIGYVIYPHGEGATPMAMEGFLFDQSPAMMRAYRAFLREKYGLDGALREAWGQEGASVETARVPGDEDFRTRAERPDRATSGRLARARGRPHRLHRRSRRRPAAARAAVPRQRRPRAD